MTSTTAREQHFCELADRLARTFATRAAAHDRQRTFPFENYVDLRTSGYLRLAVPRAYGGEEASLYELVLAQERLARGDGATAMAVDMTLHMLGRLRETRQWPAPIFEQVCRAVVAEGALINAAATEPEMGSPSHGGLPATTATPGGDGWLVTGHKKFITMAPALSYFVVSVRLPASPAMPHGGKANAIVEANPGAATPGIRMEDTWSDNLGLRTSGSYDVYFDDVFVPDALLVDRQAVPPPGELAPSGKPIFNMAWFGLTLSAVYLGIGQAACDAACTYANERTPTALGRPIATLPNIQRRVGDMSIQLTAARSVLHDVARQWSDQPDQRETMAPQIATAKYLCTNAAIYATDQALRVAGGFGLLSDLPLERYYRDVRAGVTHPPNDDAALEMVGRAALQG
ncbi:MAG: acyl-CoA/acyl-ACP dehydrogenase [Chloroflexaceae bacterium]|nr:acyl-CoA/acyl-ACP dehydrogenase [Chloroflexaceae bacterium]